jgi:hypothetical protein
LNPKPSEKKKDGRENGTSTDECGWVQMARTQKNKATAHHLGLLKVI